MGRHGNLKPSVRRARDHRRFTMIWLLATFDTGIFANSKKSGVLSGG